MKKTSDIQEVMEAVALQDADESVATVVTVDLHGRTWRVNSISSNGNMKISHSDFPHAIYANGLGLPFKVYPLHEYKK
jgi:hypothetical protein